MIDTKPVTVVVQAELKVFTSVRGSMDYRYDVDSSLVDLSNQINNFQSVSLEFPLTFSNPIPYND